MSFFDDTKNAGLLLLILAVMDIVFSLIAVFAFEEYKDLDTWKKILVIVGSVISAVIYGYIGLGIKNGSIGFQVGPFFSDVNSKFGVLVAIVAGMGVADLVSGIFQIVAFGGTSVMSVVIAVIMIVMAFLMVSGDKLAGNVVWIILLIVFILGIIASAIASIVLVGIPSLLLFIMLLIFLLSPEVKSKMGM